MKPQTSKTLECLVIHYCIEKKVIDEFCKFGVAQRQVMLEKGVLHLLLMSATPIPRSLGMTKYADLKITTINDVPSERKPIKTSIIDEKDRDQMLQFIRSQLETGHQAYIVYPLIDDSDHMNLKSAKESFKQIKANPLFENFKIGLVHGKLSLEEKEEEMRRFKNKETDILIATTVIEVGIDVPNATVMVIENSDRYGLSQLHQLRGRVGRGSAQSYCLLMRNENQNEESNERLEIICATNDGFEISEMDLKIRGPGDLLGIKQSGNLKTYLKLTKLPKENDILEDAKTVVESLFEDNLFFKNYPILAKKYQFVVRNWKYGTTS
jgi:ATP-dependent DNA helicase RecG